MKKIAIANDNIEAVVLPDFGGMVSEMRVSGKDVLRMYYGTLGLGNVLSGGIPLLFPFSSRCKDDEATFDGEVHTMPMHGFAKDLPFRVLRTWAQGCELELSSGAHTRQYYPYDFSLSVVYEIAGNALRTTLRVENRSDRRMPFAMGTHPYFLTRDRSKTEFSFGLQEYDCYLGPEVISGVLEGPISLADSHDTVFFNGSPICELVDHAGGYRAKITGDKTFSVVTVCTMQPEASCIEPWQGKPDAPNHPEACLWLDPAETGSYAYEIALSDA